MKEKINKLWRSGNKEDIILGVYLFLLNFQEDWLGITLEYSGGDEINHPNYIPVVGLFTDDYRIIRHNNVGFLTGPGWLQFISNVSQELKREDYRGLELKIEDI